MKYHTSFALIVIAIMMLTVGLLNDASGQNDVTKINPIDSPLPTPTPVSPEAEVALKFTAEQQQTPIEEFSVVGEELVRFPLLDRDYTLVTIAHDLSGTFQEFSLLVDATTLQVEPNVNAIKADENAAYLAKYGKLDVALYERLEAVSDETSVPVVIWVAHTDAERSHEEIVAELTSLYPEAAKALQDYGVAWAVEDTALSEIIERKYGELSNANVKLRMQSLTEWLKERGYSFQEFPGMPALSGTIVKREIPMLVERNDIAQLHLNDPKTATALDQAVSTGRIPSVWTRGITGSNVKLAIVERDKINAAASACMNIIDRGPTPLPANEASHKSYVATIAACNNATYRGVAYGTQILDAAFTPTDPNWFVNALIWAVDTKLADVANLSEVMLGGNSGLYWQDRAFDYWVRQRTFVATIGAGNFNDGAPVLTPGKGWNVITVGGFINKADSGCNLVVTGGNANWSDDVMWDCSSYENPTTGVEKPEVVAVANNTTTTASDRGTSASAPHVAGLAALLMERNGTLKNLPTAVKAIIMASAVHNIEGSQRLSDKDGAGAIDASLADQIAQTAGGSGTCNTPCWWSVNTTAALPSVNTSVDRFFNATRGERIRVAIAWLSQADSSYGTDSLLTNYNLYIYNSNGSLATSSVSSVNGFEIVDFTAPSTDQYKIQVYRSATGDNNEASNTVGVAWAKLSTYLPDIRRNTADGWTSTIYVRNDGAEPRNVKVTFFNTNGSFNSDTSLTLDPNAVWINPLPPNNWQGSAIVEGSEEVSVVVVQERGSPYTHEAYAGVGNPAADVLVPLVHRHNGLNSSPATDWNSDIFIQNAGGAATNVTLQFTPAPGAGNAWTFTNYFVGLAPGASGVVNVGGLPNIGISVPPNNINGNERFVGSVRITAGQPLAIASTQYNLKYGTSTISQMMETSNTQLPATVLYAPLVQNSNNGWLSGLALSRLAGSEFDLYYYRNDTGLLCHSQLNLNNNPQIVFPAPSSGNPCPTTPNGKWQADANMTANVNQLQGAVNATTYAAIALPSKTVSIAKVRRDGGWSDGFVVMNVNTSAATVTVRLYNANGTENGSSPIYNTALGAGQSVTLLGQIPVGFNGSAVVNATLPVAVSVNSWQSGGGSGDTIGSYPGNHR